MDIAQRSLGGTSTAAVLERDGSPGSELTARTRRVLRWSGPGGWRASRPLLVPRRVGTADASDAGFSLIELLVALLVMGILLAIAIPTFLGTTNAADDRSAQSNLATALTDAEATFQQQGQTFGTGAGASAALATTLQAGALDLSFKAGSLGSSPALGSSGTLSDVSVAVSGDGNGVVLAAYSVPGNCFYVVDNSGALSAAAAGLAPYVGTSTVTSVMRPVSGALGLPTRAGTSYVTVAGDTDKGDCNAYRPRAAPSGTKAAYQSAGFANAPTT